MPRSEYFRPSQLPRVENVAVVEQKSPPLADFAASKLEFAQTRYLKYRTASLSGMAVELRA